MTTETLVAPFQGAYTALVTPFHQGKLDENALENLIDWQIEQGIDGLVCIGTTGESPTLTTQEHKRVIEIAVKTAANRVPVIAGAGSNNPIEAIEYAQFAQKTGADAILSVAGYYNKPSQAGLYAHFKLLHDATDISMVIYNIPPRTIVDILPATMAKLAQLPRVIGVKDATMQLGRISLERALINKPNFSYLSGEDMTSVAYNAMGGHGCISVVANILPNLFAQLQHCCLQGNYAQARQLNDKLTALNQALYLEPSPAGVKYALSLLGKCSAEARLPIVPLSDTSKQAIKRALVRLEQL